MTDYILYQYAAYGPRYLDDSLRGTRRGGSIYEFAKPLFTPSERAAMIKAVERRIKKIGGGSLKRGIQKVKARYEDFWRRLMEK